MVLTVQELAQAIQKSKLSEGRRALVKLKLLADSILGTTTVIMQMEDSIEEANIEEKQNEEKPKSGKLPSR